MIRPSTRRRPKTPTDVTAGPPRARPPHTARRLLLSNARSNAAAIALLACAALLAPFLSARPVHHLINAHTFGEASWGQQGEREVRLRPRLLIVQVLPTVNILRELCSAVLSQQPGPTPSATREASHTCQWQMLAGLDCQHFYTTAIKGVAGMLSDGHVDHMRTCLGDKLLFVEEDGQVIKAEGPSHEVQRVSGVSRSDSSSPHQGRTDGGPDSIPAERNAWLQTLGAAAQQQVSRGPVWVAGAAPNGKNASASQAKQCRNSTTCPLPHPPLTPSIRVSPIGLQPTGLQLLPGEQPTAVGANSTSQQPGRSTGSNSSQQAGPSTGGNSSGSSSGSLGVPSSPAPATTARPASSPGQPAPASGAAAGSTSPAGGSSRPAAAGAAATGSVLRHTVRQQQSASAKDVVVGREGLHSYARVSDGRMVSDGGPTPRPQADNPEPAAPKMPSTPPELPGSAPGPSSPLSQDALAVLAAGADKHQVKLERLPAALWGLDRLDQRDPPLDRAYTYGSQYSAGMGTGVTIYALDSGVRASHQEFRNWSAGGGSRASYGPDFVGPSDKAQSEDCDGHGTHVGATAIGRSVGVAKGAKLVAVRVLDCLGSGTISDTVAGLDWVARNVVRPAVVMMSLGVPAGSWSRALEVAIKSMIEEQGISVVVASGNNAVDACTISPASLPNVITVAGSNMDNKFSATNPRGTETMYRWSNTGSCVNIFAPGVEIWSACGGVSRCPAVSDDAYTWASGTSMAVPHVAGTAAIYLESWPSANPGQVAAALLTSASTDKITDNRMRQGTPNRLLYSRGVLSGGDGLMPVHAASGQWANTSIG